MNINDVFNVSLGDFDIISYAHDNVILCKSKSWFKVTTTIEKQLTECTIIEY